MNPKNFSAMDEILMLKCLMLAEKGAGYTSPNPLVGAILVKNGKIIGKGYHRKFGGAHAEVNAIRSAKCSVQGSTLYVNLEPCNYYGKTPPCTDLIISSKISKVVAGMLDPNPLVSGKGINKLRRSGVKVIVGVLENECRKLNEAFTKYITTGMPFVTLKIAQTLDGKIADKHGKSKWITSSVSRKFVHLLRSRYDAILVGKNTLRHDNPELTVRAVKGRNPHRIIISKSLDIPDSLKIFKNADSNKTIIYTNSMLNSKKLRMVEKFQKLGIEVVFIKNSYKSSISLSHVLKDLGNRNITSVLVEGGSETFSEFINQKVVDKIITFIAPKILGQGIDSFKNISNLNISSVVQLNFDTIKPFGDDLLIETYINN